VREEQRGGERTAGMPRRGGWGGVEHGVGSRPRGRRVRWSGMEKTERASGEVGPGGRGKGKNGMSRLGRRARRTRGGGSGRTGERGKGRPSFYLDFIPFRSRDTNINRTTCVCQHKIMAT
jgi:hypothetical protein